MTTATRVVMLGTGNPGADPYRSGPAVAIVVGDRPYLVDCGPGVVRRAAAAELAGIDALETRRLTRLFLTHLHSDHTAGFPDLLLTPWVLGRAEPLQVYGPPGTRVLADHVRQAYAEDIDVRLHGLEHASPEGWKTDVHEFRAGKIYEDDRVRVRAFRVKHGTWRHAFGLRFETADRTVVISGDTRPCADLLRHGTKADVLIHEVYSHVGFAGRSPHWRRYHAGFHTSTRQLASIAKRLKPGLLVLYHQLHFGVTDNQLVAEIRDRYPGPIVSARDLDVL